MNLLKRFLYAGLLLPLLLAGCTIKEDRSDCPPDGADPTQAYTLQMYFGYSPLASVQDEQLLQKLDLYVFDANGVLQSVWLDNDPFHNPLNIPSPSAGNYRLVAWASPLNGYTIYPQTVIPGSTKFSQLELDIPSRNDTLNYQPLFHVDTMINIPNHTAVQQIALLLKPAYNTINLTLKNIPEPSDSHNMFIRGNWNGAYRFDLSSVAFGVGNNKVYTPYSNFYTAASAQLLSSFRISQLLATDRANGRLLYLDLYDVVSHVQLGSLDLITLLRGPAQAVNYDAYVYSETIDLNAP